VKLSDIQHALVTHIHLDHAGAAGHLARNGATIYVHEFGAKHLIDPSKLIDSATRIYGEQMDRLWGRLLPVPEDQIVPVHDGDVIRFGRFEIRAIETPGHARHHHAFAIEDVCFVGDIGGITLPVEIVPEPPRGSYLTVPTPPPEFELGAWLASIDRLAEMEFRVMYPTHFGARHAVREHWHHLAKIVPQHTEFVCARLESGAERAQLIREYISWNREQARQAGVGDADFARYVSINLLTMNVDGIIRYWNKVAQR
jgi:glyoxylase-like metal-dependent hydrolase (beta-lactamase superfamily II)